MKSELSKLLLETTVHLFDVIINPKHGGANKHSIIEVPLSLVQLMVYMTFMCCIGRIDPNTNYCMHLTPDAIFDCNWQKRCNNNSMIPINMIRRSQQITCRSNWYGCKRYPFYCTYKIYTAISYFLNNTCYSVNWKK